MTTWPDLRSSSLPPNAPLPRYLDNALTGALAVFGLVLPLSVAGVSLSMAILLLFALVLSPRLWRSAPWREPVVAVGLVLLAWIAAHTALTADTVQEGLSTVNRYHELLMAAILLGLFRLSSRPRAFLNGLLVGCLVYAVLHWLGPWVPAIAGELQPRSISAGLVLGLGGFVFWQESRNSNRPAILRLAALFLAATVLFQVRGRTGQLILLLLVSYGAWCWVTPRRRWLVAGGMALLVVATALSFGKVRERWTDTLHGLTRAPGWETTSTGIRVELMRNALHLAGQHYLLGVGYGGYADVHEEVVEARDRQANVVLDAPRPWARIANPHGEYLMQLVGGGIVGLGLFLTWLFLPALRLVDGRAQPALVAASAAFAVGCLFNSMLMDFVEGHFFVALLTWLLAQTAASRRDTPAPVP